MQPNRRWVPLLYFIPLLALAAFIAWRVVQKKALAASDAKTAAARKNAPLNVDVAPATRRTLVRNFEAAGSIEAPATVQIAPKVTGLLATLSVREGDRVKTGQHTATIDPRETVASLRQKQAALAGARSRLAQAQATQGATDIGVISDVQKGRAALATAQAQNVQARADFAATVAAAESAVTAAKEQVAGANSGIASADAGIASAKASLTNAKSDAARQTTLAIKGIVAQSVADNAQTQLAVQQANLQVASEKRAAAVATRDAALAAQQSAEKQLTIARAKAQADVAVANATLAQNQATLRATQANTAQTAAYRENLLALQAAVASAEADVQSAQVLVSETTLVSPLDGIVSARLIEPGAVVSPTTPILSVQSVRRVWATVAVPEEVSRFLAVGQTGTVTLDALPGRTFTGRIGQVLPSADPQSRQFTVRVVLDNPAFQLRPGTFARVRFVTGVEKDVLTVPQEAVKTDDADPNTHYVFVAGADNGAHQVTVQTKDGDSKGVIITGGDLHVGDKVIVLSGRDVKDGQPIRAGGASKNGKNGKSGKGKGKHS